MYGPGVFVVGGESCGVSRFGDGARRSDLLKSVDALSSSVEGVHQMHGGRFVCEGGWRGCRWWVGVRG